VGGCPVKGVGEGELIYLKLENREQRRKEKKGNRERDLNGKARDPKPPSNPGVVRRGGQKKDQRGKQLQSSLRKKKKKKAKKEMEENIRTPRG